MFTPIQSVSYAKLPKINLYNAASWKTIRL